MLKKSEVLEKKVLKKILEKSEENFEENSVENIFVWDGSHSSKAPPVFEHLIRINVGKNFAKYVKTCHVYE